MRTEIEQIEDFLGVEFPPCSVGRVTDEPCQNHGKIRISGYRPPHMYLCEKHHKELYEDDWTEVASAVQISEGDAKNLVKNLVYPVHQTRAVGSRAEDLFNKFVIGTTFSVLLLVVSYVSFSLIMSPPFFLVR